jgi:hypothetical protein
VTPKSKAKKLPTARRLLVDSVKQFARHWRTCLGVVAIVALPANLLTAWSRGEAASNLGAYSSMAALFLNLALIWLAGQLAAGQRVSLKSAYYQGTQPIMRFMLVAAALVLQLIPLIIATALLLGMTSSDALVAERIILGGLALILAGPTVYWVTRYNFGLLAVCASDLSPVAALRASAAAVQGRFWLVLGRLAALFGLTVIVTLPLILLTVPANQNVWLVFAVQSVVSLVSLPVIFFYWHKLYAAL